MSTVPKLRGDAAAAVKHRGGHLQIIASAGSGKTEVVAQRIADLFADGVRPAQVVAFTFTEAAAAELKTRVEERVTLRLGAEFRDQLNGCFIGTIHAYCFSLLQRHVPKFEAYDVLDEHGLSAFLAVTSHRIGPTRLNSRLFRAIQEFRANIDVVENELLDIADLEGDFQDIARKYYEELERRRFLTFGQQIQQAVRALETGGLLEAIHKDLRHLIMDEYQDVNPAQERLIELLASGPVELCVVGDDDQSIYQWRGADVANIMDFQQRYDAKQYGIVTNMRSRPGIIRLANKVSGAIEERLPKEMRRHRKAAKPDHTIWVASTEEEEAATIANTIRTLHEQGWRYGDMAILVRGRVAYPELLRALADIPVATGAATGLFDHPLARLFGRTLAFLANLEWGDKPWGPREGVSLDDLTALYVEAFELSKKQRRDIKRHLEAWRSEVEAPKGPADLVGDYYRLLEACGVLDWDPENEGHVARLGALAQCSRILADFEGVQRRARSDPEAAGEQVGGQDRGQHFFFRLATFVQNYARGAYEGFEGEDDLAVDAVTLTTVHRAKGLEWPIVFVPSLTARRFPASMTGRSGTWHVPEHLFRKERYEGSKNDERRLFYVAATRARDWLSLSAHKRVTKNSTRLSPFLNGLGTEPYPDRPTLPPPPEEPVASDTQAQVRLTFSELADFLRCPYAYRLRHRIGFERQLAPELGYGKAVHHTLRRVAELYQESGAIPSDREVDALFDDEFFLPFASKPAHRQLKNSARNLVAHYIEAYAEDFERVWAVERPFELHLDDAVISGRADVILDREDGIPHSLALVDYKTSQRQDDALEFDLQLQVYASAGRREGLTVRAAYLHVLSNTNRKPVDIDEATIGAAEQRVGDAVRRYRAGAFAAAPSATACKACDMRLVCRYRATTP